MSYTLIAIVIFLVGLFVLGKLQKKYKIYTDNEGRIQLIIVLFGYSAGWIISLPLTILIASVVFIVLGSMKLLKKFEG